MHITILLLTLVLFQFFYVNSLTPLSECTTARITSYPDYEKGGSCMFGPPKIYGAAPNTLFYNKGEKCGICYELVTPDDVLYFMVDSNLADNDTVKGLHFDLHRNAFNSVIKNPEFGGLNVTIRMVACRHEGNIILKTKKEVNPYYYSFVVTNHVLGLRKVYYSYDNKTWIGLTREGTWNHWTVPSPIKFPIYFQFESISGEKVGTKITELKAGYDHDTGVQFKVPKNKYYAIDTLKEITNPKKEKCCKIYDAYTDIYYEGKFLGEWMYSTNVPKEEINFAYTKNCYEGKKCIKIELYDWKFLTLFTRLLRIETRKYSALEFYVKSAKKCKNCLMINSDRVNFFTFGTEIAGQWEKKVITLKDLKIKNDTFTGFNIQGSIKDRQLFYFDNFKLVKSDFVDNGVCYKEK